MCWPAAIDGDSANSQVCKFETWGTQFKRARKSYQSEDQDLERACTRAAGCGRSGEGLHAAHGDRGFTLPVLAGLLRKKWIARETSAVERDARRTERFAVLIPEARLPVSDCEAAGDSCRAGGLRRRACRWPSCAAKSCRLPRCKRWCADGLVRIDERAAAFRLGGIEASGEPIRAERAADRRAGRRSRRPWGRFSPFLLHGVTGSGKTAVYLAAMQRALDRGLASILLVPEIGLTPQMAGLLDAAFGARVALLHSALTPEERSEQWRRIHRGDAPIVVGTRSAIFAPVPNLGLILVDEEHDQSYKQEETPRYNARDVAVMRAKLADAVVVLASATPSLESWQNSVQGKYTRIEMRDRVMNRPLPEVELIDMRREFQETGQEQLFSRALIAQTQRGSRPRRAGAHSAQSPRLLLCRDLPRLRRKAGVPELRHRADPPQAGDRTTAGDCARRASAWSATIAATGARFPRAAPSATASTSTISAQVRSKARSGWRRSFPPRASAAWTATPCAAATILNGCWRGCTRGEINLLVGTQMIAKGHDIHGITLVGVVGCDHALSMPDFRAAERVFQLMTQVSGRAGRGELPGRVVVQTYYPDHYAILAASTHNYASLRGARAEVPPLDALSALRRAGQRAGAIAKAGGSGALVGGAGQVVPEGRAGRSARAGALHRAHCAHQGRLSLSHDSEGRLAQGAECSAARHAGARG